MSQLTYNKMKTKVKEIAPIWTNYCSIMFRFVENGDSQERIKFNLVGYNSSDVGVRALQNNDQTQPTIDLSFTDVDAKRNILHEFGHVLGLVHEHQIPKSWGNILVFKSEDEIMNIYRDRSDESRNKIRKNITNKYSDDQLQYNGRAFDKDSIMRYAFPRAILKEVNGEIPEWALTLPGNLSAGDIATIRQLYPSVITTSSI